MLDIKDITNTIIQGDCLEIMKQLPDNCVDLVLTDPPYDAKTHKGAILADGIDFPPLASVQDLVDEMLRVSKRWVIAFCSLEMLGDYKKASGNAWIRSGVWHRVCNMPQLSGDRPAQACEGVAIMHNEGKKIWNGGGKAAFWQYSVERGKKKHPTQKPYEMFSHILKQFSFENETVLDCYFGSGTTGVSCEKINRNYIGIEISQEYCQIARRRVREAKDSMGLFKGTGQ
jgi:DNA modification methylase